MTASKFDIDLNEHRFLLTEAALCDGRHEHYLATYDALCAHGARALRSKDESDLKVLACAAYGWMPTVLKSFNVLGMRRLAKALHDAVVVQDTRDVLVEFEESPPVNGSWVGTSKFAHFMRPDLMPIWDSRIAKLCGYGSPASWNTSSAYAAWMDVAHDLSTHATTQANLAVFERLAKRRDWHSITPIRAVELSIFQVTADKHRSRENDRQRIDRDRASALK